MNRTNQRSKKVPKRQTTTTNEDERRMYKAVKDIRKTEKKRLRKKAKSLARESAVNFVGEYIGPENARAMYKVANYVRKSRAPSKKLHLSDVSSRYLLAHLKPFDVLARQAHIPTTPSYPTYKVMGFVRGTAYIGLQGVGFVALNPTTAKDQMGVLFTNANYNYAVTAQTTSDADQPNGSAYGPGYANFSNLPYSRDDLLTNAPGVKIESRIVAASLRVQYTGTELNRSGMFYAYNDPDGDNVLGGSHFNGTPPNGYSIASISQKEATEIFPVTKKFVQLLALPPDMDRISFTNTQSSNVRQVYPYTNNDYTYKGSSIPGTTEAFGSAASVIMITGIPGQSLYFEAVVHVEYEGAGVTQSFMTDSESDVVGLDAVQNLLSKAQRKNASDAQNNFAAALKSVMKAEGVVMGVGKRSVDY